MIDHDQLFKQLLKTFFCEFVDVFLPAVAAYLDPASIEFLDKELFHPPAPGKKRSADLVAKARFKGQPTCFLLHLEPESARRRRRGLFVRRMFDYFALLTREYGLPVYPVALLSYDTPRDAEDDTFRVAFPDRTVLEFRIFVIQLKRLNWRAFLKQDNPAAAALMALMGFASTERVEVKKECLRMIVRLRYDREKTHLLATFVDTYLRLNAEEERRLMKAVKRLPHQEREVAMELMTSWEERGLQKGLQQGEQRGALNVVLSLLEERVGALNKRLQTAVEHLPLEQLTQLAKATYEFERASDVTRWLRAHATTNGSAK